MPPHWAPFLWPTIAIAQRKQYYLARGRITSRDLPLRMHARTHAHTHTRTHAHTHTHTYAYFMINKDDTCIIKIDTFRSLIGMGI